MALPGKPRGFVAAAAAGISLALLLPAQAQFWDWGGRPQRQYQRDYNPFGGWFSPGPRESPRYYGDRERESPADYSRAPGPSQKKPEATTSIVVMGDANADWLAYGLEDAFAEKPEIGIVRKHRTDSGLIRYDGRRDSEWGQVAREIIAAEKPKFIVMMVGNNDRQQIRERAAATARPGAAKQNAQPAPPGPSAAQAPPDPEQQASELPAEQPPAAPEQGRATPIGPLEFRSEKWEAAYIRRVDATIAVLKGAGVPVIWVGLPSQRGSRASADSSYLNDIYRSRSEKAGIVYVDIWDGFVDEAGRFSPHGPDYEGQTRRLRTNDGVYFTKFGARKLAHYVEREIQRHLTNRGMPVALPVPAEQGPQTPNAGGPAQRPVAGPVVPLTTTKVVAEELLGAGRAPRAPAVDATATRVLTKGEPIAAPSGRADDFSWPRGPSSNAEPAAAAAAGSALAATPATPDAPDAPRKTRQRTPTTDAKAGQADGSAEAKPVRRRPRTQNPNVQRAPWPFQNFFR